MINETTNCTVCGQVLDENGQCRQGCQPAVHVWTVRDWRPLLTLGMVIVLGFSFTRLVVNGYEAKWRALAAAYSASGNQVLEEWTKGVRKSPAPAVNAFENAVIYSHGDYQYQLKLTDALLDSGATSEAMAQLRALLDQRPGDAQVKLELARLDARRGHVDDALRDYLEAIEGVWPTSDPFPQRVAVRFELAEYLIAQSRHEQAEAVLTALAGMLPVRWPEQSRLGELFLRNGDADAALNVYQEQLTLNQNDPAALLGAARASLAAGNYVNAKRYLTAVKPENAESRELLAQLERMQMLDPFASGVTSKVRTEKTMAVFRIAVARLGRCGVPPGAAVKGVDAKDAEQWSGLVRWSDQLSPLMNEHKLRGRDDVIENTMRFAFQAEMTAEKDCGQGSLDDEALLLLARERLGARR